MADLLTIANARLAEIARERFALGKEAGEIETAIAVFKRLTEPQPAPAAPLPVVREETSAPVEVVADGQHPIPLVEADAPLPVGQTGTVETPDGSPPAESEAVEISAPISDAPHTAAIAEPGGPKHEDSAPVPDHSLDAGGMVTLPVQESQFPGSTTQDKPTADDDKISDLDRGPENYRPAPQPGKSVEPSGSAAPTLAEVVSAAVAEHPDWDWRQIAEHVGRPGVSVRSTMGRLKRDARLDPGEPTLKQRILDLYEAHPEYTARDAIEFLGCPRGSFQAYTSTLGLKWGQSPEPAREPVETVEPVAAPDGQPDQSPVRANGHASETRFFLRNEGGEYLHQGTHTFTRIAKFYWTGTEADILSLKKAKPYLSDLAEQVAG